jgi:hypothetical protein
MEMTIALALAARRFSMSMIDERPLEVRLAGITRPDRPLVVRLRPVPSARAPVARPCISRILGAGLS